MATPYTLIDKKKNGKSLSREEIQFFVDAVVRSEFDDSQIGAFLMAAFLKGLNNRETADLTNAMMLSGKTYQFQGKEVIDKHSTGGVGDKTTFILAPIAISCGVKVPMIAGRGLGHTGGTVDKIEAIKGFKTKLTHTQITKQMKKYGYFLIGQTNDLAPADKKLYSVRDITATVDSIPLITASIMSKKLAEGANGYVFDVKVGNGAFMQKMTDAKALADSLAKTANRFKKPAMTLITDMNRPLGRMIGNSLEIIECLDVLKGKGPDDLTEVSLELAAGMIELAGIQNSHRKAYQMAKEALLTGQALEKFEELIKIQGGDTKFIQQPQRLPIASEQTIIRFPSSGYLATIQTKNLGQLLVRLGGGRVKSSDKIDHSVGIEMLRERGDKVKKGDPLLKFYHHSGQKNLVSELKKVIFTEIVTLTKTKPKTEKLIKLRKVYPSN